MFLQQLVFAEKLCNIFLQQNCCKKFGFCNIKIVAKKKAIVAKKKTYGGGSIVAHFRLKLGFSQLAASSVRNLLK